ncbi:MAG: trypsin-like peptidase domain-containing protein [Solirubrobacteraceae bacterium]|jgi:S1-C subfamily serine protease
MTPSDGSRIRPIAAVVVLLAAGVLGGHLIWSSTTVKTRPTRSASLFGPAQGRGFSGSCAGNGCSFSFNGGSFGNGAGNSASGSNSGNVASSITNKVDPGIVDINTNLGYDDGEAAGTGMVITASGEVFTNNHVIVGATKITATDLGNGNTYTARVVGYDHGHDIAVLQLENASGLKTVSLGNSSSLTTGQNIATIGNAGGTGGTPSAASGQVTALNQSITAGDELDGSQEHLSGLIELDGDLQPGDSGGPLVNNAGDVVGMDTAASSTFEFESSSGNGFAIPIREVEKIANEILKGTTIGTIHIGATPFLGVKINTTSSTSGADVAVVIPGTPAASTSLAQGDVITALGGTSVSSPSGLTGLVLTHHPGDSVQITWKTPSGATRTGTLKLASGPPQ